MIVFIYNTAINFFKNGSWYCSQKLISQHAACALNGLYNILNIIELPVEQKFKLVDTLVGSILNFGAEIWGTHNATVTYKIYSLYTTR